MSVISTVEWLGLFLVSALAATLALHLHGLILTRRTRSPDKAPPEATDSHLLLEDHHIIGQDLQALPADHPIRSALCWEDLRDLLCQRFDGLPEDPEILPEGTRRLLERDGAKLDMLRKGRRTRLILSEADAEARRSDGHGADRAACMAALNAVPDPIWRTDPGGNVLWQNAACSALFTDADTRSRMMAPATRACPDSDTRIHITQPGDGGRRCFELRHVSIDADMLYFARDMTQIVHAETVQRDFVQTLTKTFASLTTGLAVFDKARRLALFNPALLDLTGTQAGFLSARPGLMDFFDRLREEQIMPEPKNYADWRAQIRDVVTQANDGLYQDLWSLPNGVTYRITGRPHPDGAIAFLFEDISAEISLTRRFRRQIELRQSVLDGLDDAVAVFAPNNLLMFCNTACTTLLKVDPDRSFADMSLRDFLAATRSALGDSAEAQALGERLLDGGNVETNTATLGLADGHWATVRMVPLAGGVRMLILRLDSGRAVAETRVTHAS